MLNSALNTNQQSDLTLTIICSQINTYYQYSKKERPIHFGLVQSKPGEPRSLLCSIKIPVDTSDAEGFKECCQLLGNEENRENNNKATAAEMDSLKHVYNIDFGNPNRFSRGGNKQQAGTIKEESEMENSTNKQQLNDEGKNLGNDDDSDSAAEVVLKYF